MSGAPQPHVHLARHAACSWIDSTAHVHVLHLACVTHGLRYSEPPRTLHFRDASHAFAGDTFNTRLLTTMDGGNMRVDNPAPVVFRKRGTRRPMPEPVDEDDDRRELFDSAEVYEHLQNISDPEHPYTLEQVRCCGAQGVLLLSVAVLHKHK